MRSAKEPVDGVAIGKRIVRARKELGGMTGRELADALNVSERSMRDYESGATIPWRHLEQLARILNRSEAWLLHGREPRDPAAERHREVMRALEKLSGQVRDLKVDVGRAAARSRVR
jgi:transcriptional regulator with XRE-family HTH domain